VAELGAPIAGGDVRLEPMAEVHRAALKAACAEDLAVWPIYATSWDPDHFDETFDLIMSLKRWCRFVIFSGDALVGMSCFINVDTQRGALEIGNTYYVPALRGTGFNRAVKDLMLARAIDCGFRRIEFKVDARNARSQAAMTKLGAVREGVIRADRITWTGHVRDTVLFSILASEWDRSGRVHRSDRIE
jgi:RimJ/RimL family protein N-acetyltransferase